MLLFLFHVNHEQHKKKETKHNIMHDIENFLFFECEKSNSQTRQTQLKTSSNLQVLSFSFSLYISSSHPTLLCCVDSHVRTCDYFLIIISHVASAISFSLTRAFIQFFLFTKVSGNSSERSLRDNEKNHFDCSTC
jgi:hypothetical protein